MKKSIKIISALIVLVMLMNTQLSMKGATNEGRGKWETKASMLVERTNCGVAQVNGKMYVMGGKVSGTYYNTVEEYNPETDTWSRKADMPTARTHFQIIEANNKIYAIGGLGKNQVFLNTVEEYNPETDTWATKANMPTARDYFAVAEVDGKIYIMGGRRSDLSKTNIVEEYDPLTDSWTTKAESPIRFYIASAQEANGEIYLMGGNNSFYSKQVYVYNPTSNMWTTKTSMPTKRGNFTLANIDDKLYVIGGSNDKNAYLNTIDEYDISKDEWTSMENMPTSRSGLGSVAIGNKIYTIGGRNTQYLNTLEVFSPYSDSSPNKPNNLIAKPKEDYITLHWDNVEEANSYVVLRSTTPSAINTIIASGITETSYNDTDVKPGVTYYYVVRAIKEGIESADSNIASAMLEESNNRALLFIKLVDGNDKEYDLSMDEVNAFIDWYDDVKNVETGGYYIFSKQFNIGPFKSRKDYIAYNKIIYFEVNEYENK